MIDRCARCSRALEAGPVFEFQAGGQSCIRCWRCALGHPPMLRRSLVIAAIVGTLLLAINHGDALFSGQWSPALAWKAPLTYLVPFVVATCGALFNTRVR
jgi:hypothetical protein